MPMWLEAIAALSWWISTRNFHHRCSIESISVVTCHPANEALVVGERRQGVACPHRHSTETAWDGAGCSKEPGRVRALGQTRLKDLSEWAMEHPAGHLPWESRLHLIQLAIFKAPLRGDATSDRRFLLRP
jgi:hypothetical protein